jgi:hypothetical protein
MEQILFLAKLQNLSKFWIIKFGNKSILNLVWILKGFKTSSKNLINPSKFNPHMYFKNMNLDWLTCIKEFEVSLQMINMTWFIKTKPYKIRIRRKKQKLEILDVVFEISNEVEDIASDLDDMFNDLYVVIFMLHYWTYLSWIMNLCIVYLKLYMCDE